MATFEKLEKSRVKIQMEIPADKLSDAMQAAYEKTRGRYDISGFRKGKAPRKMIENMYGEGVFLEDAFELIYGDVYSGAIEELKLEPVERPDIEIQSISISEGVKFSAEVAVYPEVVLGKYKGIEIEKKEYTVLDADIDAFINKERERIARYVEKDRPVKQGDRVILNYSGSVDGVKFDGGTAEDQQLDIGSGRFIPGFEEQLVGFEKGQEGAINVKFPDEYHAEALKGKDAVFEVLIKAIQERELPELDDEFAKDVSEFDTLAGLRESKRQELQKRNDERAKAEMEDEALKIVGANATVDIPDVMVGRQMDYMMQDFSYRLAMSGMNMEDYCRYMDIDPNAMRESYREEALERVRVQLALEAVKNEEKVECDDESLNKEYENYASRSGKSVEDLVNSLSDDDKEYFKDRVAKQKAIDIIMENAKQVKAKKPAKADDKAKAEKAEKIAKAEKTEKPAKAEKAEKAPVKAAKAEKAEKPVKAEKPKKNEKIEKPAEE